MTNLQSIMGGAIWAVTAALLLCAALEPVELRAQDAAQTRQVAGAAVSGTIART